MDGRMLPKLLEVGRSLAGELDLELLRSGLDRFITSGIEDPQPCSS
jgi:hypothetical protein